MRARNLPTKPTIYLCTLPRIYTDGKYGDAERARVGADEVTPKIRELAKATGCGLIELDSLFSDKPRKDVYQDTLHPNPAGYRQIAETVLVAITGKQPDRRRYK